MKTDLRQRGVAFHFPGGLNRRHYVIYSQTTLQVWRQMVKAADYSLRPQGGGGFINMEIPYRIAVGIPIQSVELVSGDEQMGGGKPPVIGVESRGKWGLTAKMFINKNQFLTLKTNNRG